MKLTVEDYLLSRSNRIVILIFKAKNTENTEGYAGSRQSVENYLADICSPYDFMHLHRTADKSKILAMLTEYYEHKQNTQV